MRTLVALLAGLTLAGCSLAGLQRATNRDGMSTEERASYDAKLDQEREKRDAAKAELKPGSSLEQVEYAWGKPDQVDYRDGKKIYWYENGGSPIAISFKGGQVDELYHDRNFAQQQKAIEAQKRPVTCVSTRLSGGSFTECN